MVGLGLTQVLVALVALVPARADNPLSWIRTSDEDRHFYDEFGRVRIFHGSNRVMKADPWYFADMLESEDEFDLMAEMGFNVMRLGYMWSGVNPAEGIVNQTYINVVKSIVDKMAARGVYTLLDMHEDVLSSKFCLYDGAPLWVINKSVPDHEFPWPFQGNCSSRGWMANTLTEAAAHAYQDIYDNNYGMMDDLASFWRTSAEQFQDVSSVIGYETMNEPFAGGFYQDPTLLLPGVAGAKNLQRLHDTCAAAIREHDERHIVFYEPVTWGMLFDGKIAGSGFTHVPGGESYKNRSAFSYHYYCASFVPEWTTSPLKTSLVCDHITGPLVFKAVNEDLVKLGGGAMMTEGMSCGDTDTQQHECNLVMDNLDDNLFSWTDYANSQGSLWDLSQAQKERWSRSYARAVAGGPLRMAFDPQTKDFDFCFSIDTEISAPTEIFASTVYSYGASGPVINTTENVAATVDEENPDLILVVPKADATSGEEACVHLTKA